MEYLQYMIKSGHKELERLDTEYHTEITILEERVDHAYKSRHNHFDMCFSADEISPAWSEILEFFEGNGFVYYTELYDFTETPIRMITFLFELSALKRNLKAAETRYVWE